MKISLKKIAFLAIFFGVASISLNSYSFNFDKVLSGIKYDSEQLRQTAIDKGIIPDNLQTIDMKKEFKNKNTLIPWIVMEKAYKKALVNSIIVKFKQKGIIIEKFPEYYIDEINGVIYESIFGGDFNKDIKNAIEIIFTHVAIVSGDYGDGRNKIDTLKDYLGTKGFYKYRKENPGRVKALEKESSAVDDKRIILRVVVVNPSKDKNQKVEIKSYLPSAIKERDVVDLGGLTLKYDSDKEAYYVHEDSVKLSPSEVRTFNIEIKDIWRVSSREIASLKQRTAEIFEFLTKSKHSKIAEEMAEGVYQRLDKIRKLQDDESLSRQEYIDLYPKRLNILEEAKDMIAKMDAILFTVTDLPKP